MDLLLGNLATLKRHLLPGTWETETSLDDVLAELGKGVASGLQDRCNRIFARATAQTFDIPASTELVSVPRYPLESVATVEIKYASDAAWTTLTDVIANISPIAGLIYLYGTQGGQLDRLRVTYTGGYWYDTTEDASGTQPAGSTALPYALQQAWLLQCHHIFAAHDMMSTRSLPNGSKEAVAEINLTDAVKALLTPYHRPLL